MTSYIKENYIKALFHLHQKNENISLSELGDELKVSKPTANDMIKKLKKEGIVTSEKYKPIKITEKGRRVASSIIRKHRLSEMFLSQIMNFDWGEVHEIAEELEHIKIEKFFDRMDELLGFPKVDPHGSAIPDKNGNFSKPHYHTLSQVKENSIVKLKALRESSTELINFLNKKDIKLNTIFRVDFIEPFDNSITISYNDKNGVVLSKSVTDKLLVKDVKNKILPK